MVIRDPTQKMILLLVFSSLFRPMRIILNGQNREKILNSLIFCVSDLVYPITILSELRVTLLIEYLPLGLADG